MFLYPICHTCHVNLPPAVCRVDDLHAALKRHTSSFHLQQDRGSSHIQGQTTLLACNRPRLPWPEFLGFTDDREMVCLHVIAHLSPSFLTGGVSYSVRKMLNRSFGGSNLPICHSHVGRYRPFSSQISPDQGERLLPEPNCAGKLTGKPPTRNPSAAQPGRNQPHRREAFLRLARSYRIEALPRQSRHRCNHRRALP